MKYRNNKEKKSYGSLKIDCSKCFGLCCVALYFSTMDNFPEDKVAGEPCINLNKDFTCKIHKDLDRYNLRGCMNFDCFGAGQKIAKHTYKDISWQESSQQSKEMYDAFVAMKNLQEMIWYLYDSITFTESDETKKRINNLIKETENLTNLCSKDILNINIDEHRIKVNYLLKEVRKEIVDKINPKAKSDMTLGFDFIGKDLRRKKLMGSNLAGALLIGSNLQNVDFSGAIIIGADMRDADIRGCNLSEVMYITQAQINSAKGNSKTKLPQFIERPSYWEV